jgi:DNA-binding transcriptional MerR regulator
MCAKTTRPSIPEGLMRLAAAAQAAGVSRQTIEYYIALGLIRPIRLAGRFGRFFDDKLIRRIKLVRRLNRSGYVLRDIRDTYFRNRR